MVQKTFSCFQNNKTLISQVPLSINTIVNMIILNVLSMCSLFLVFIKELIVNLCYLDLYFLYLQLLTLDYFIKLFILLDFSFFVFPFIYECYINMQKFASGLAINE